MPLESGSASFETTPGDAVYLQRRARDNANAAGSAGSLAATRIHVALATPYATPSCHASDSAWMAENRVW